MSEIDWLRNLKAGDSVVEYDRWNGKAIRKVERTTPTTIVLSEYKKYRRKDGAMVGNSDKWFRAYIRQPTPELVAEIRDRDDRARLLNVNWSKVPIDTVRAVLAVLRTADNESLQRIEGE